MYVLHSVPDWASLCVHVTLQEMAVPFERRIVDHAAGGLQDPAYLRLHPLGLIPALETPDGPIFETGAILLWLSERHGLAPAPGSRERAAFLSWFVFVNNGLHTTAMDMLYPDRRAGGGAVPEVAATAHTSVTRHLAALEAMVADRRPDWLSPDQPSVLGIYLSLLLRWVAAFAHFPEHRIITANYPHLQAIARAVEQRPAALRAATAEGLGGTFFSQPEI